jgi:hypothetical protein
MIEYTREQLIALCEKAHVPQEKWNDRDSSGAQRQVGEALMLLKAGCAFDLRDDDNLKTDAKTIWVNIKFKGFSYFEHSDELDAEVFYIPTAESIEKANGGDWY